MHIAGIICEYDPFHRGHAWHIQETRRRLGADTLVLCCMSGHWTQRADCASLDKWTRAKLALAGGADLVLELPLPWALSSAERFAQGGVALLTAAGADTLSFGSESGDLSALQAVADCLDSGDFQPELTRFLAQGLSFPSARQKAVQARLGPTADCLSEPNNNLGVEYLRTLRGSPLAALTVLRRGAGHHSATAAGEFASASHIRRLLRAGVREQAVAFLPPDSPAPLDEPADLSWAERALLARLRTMSEAEFAALPSSGQAEGLPARLYRAARQASGLAEFYELAKTKRYPHSRLRRLAVSAFLGLTAADCPSAPLYLRVLGLNAKGQFWLRHLKTASPLPVLTKPAHVKRLSPQAQALFALEAQATDLYGLCFPHPRPCGLDWQCSPILFLDKVGNPQ